MQGLIDLQLACGARPGELVALRAIDLDTSGAIWTAELEHHKTAHHGEKRTFYFAPHAQEILRRFMTPDRATDAPLFSAAEAEQERRSRGLPSMKGRKKATPRRPTQKPNAKRTERMIGDSYTVAAYRRAIARACEDAGVTRWSPHQLRHNAATRIRREFGIEAAQIILGHTSGDTTAIYAEVDHARALEVVAKIG